MKGKACVRLGFVWLLLFALLAGMLPVLPVQVGQADDETVTVKVRVEGWDHTLADKQVAVPKGSTAFDAVLALEPDVDVVYQENAWGKYVTGIAGENAGMINGEDYWGYTVVRGGMFDSYPDAVGADGYPLFNGDEVVFFHSAGWMVTQKPVVRWPEVNKTGQTVAITVNDETGAPSVGASVYLQQVIYDATIPTVIQDVYTVDTLTTDSRGEVDLPDLDPGEYRFSVSRDVTDAVYGSIPRLVRSPYYEFRIFDNLPKRDIAGPQINSLSYDKGIRVLTIEGNAGDLALGSEPVWVEVNVSNQAKSYNQTQKIRIGNFANYAFGFSNVPPDMYTLNVAAIDQYGNRSAGVEKTIDLTSSISLDDASQVLTKAVDYLKGTQKPDGSMDPWAAIALADVGQDLNAAPYIKNGQTFANGTSENSLISLVQDVDANSSTTDIAKYILAEAAAKQDPTSFGGKDLIAMLQARQDANGHFGSDALDETTFVNSHAYAIFALKAAGAAIPDPAGAVLWLKQSQQSDGGWGWGFGSSDPDLTAYALRALHLLNVGANDPAVQKALNYLQGLQSDSGAILTGGQPNIYSTIEVARALNQYGIKLDEAPWVKGDNSLITYLFGNQDAAGEIGNLNGTAFTVSLLAEMGIPLLDGSGGGSTGPGGGGSGVNTTFTVHISVTSKNGSSLYDGDLTMRSGDTVMDALRQTGLQLTFRFGGAYVDSINGEQAQGLEGWVYSVNGDESSLGATEYELHSGDRIAWYWGRASESGVPGAGQGSVGNTGAANTAPAITGSTLADGAPAVAADVLAGRSRASEQAKARVAVLVSQNQAAAQPGRLTQVIGAGVPWSQEEIAYWQKALADNLAQATQEVTGDQAAVVADGGGEVSLDVPAGAVGQSTVISIVEQSGQETPAASGVALLSGVYEMGPDGTQFSRPLTLAVRIPIGNDIPLDRLSLAWYDEARREWVPIPTVVDAANGIVYAKVDHFTSFAVIQRQAATYTDLGSDYDWAKTAIQHLSDQGILQGMNAQRFEPQAELTRAQWVTMLVQAAGTGPAGTDGQEAPVSFGDVKADDWYAPYVTTAAAQGWLTGYPDGRFKPDAPITRMEIAAILSRIAGRPTLDNQQREAVLSAYLDKDRIPEWARSGMADAVSYGWMTGRTADTLAPDAHATRAEAAVLLYHYLETEVE